MTYLIIWVVCIIISAAVLSSYNKAGTGFILGLLLGPIGLIIAVVMAATAGSAKQHKEKMEAIKQANNPTPDDTARKERACPYCAEPILEEAIICKHCSKEVEPMPSTAQLIS